MNIKRFRAVFVWAVFLVVGSTSAHAHRSDSEANEVLSKQQAQMALDMQSLRDEIAELRDLVERQQYELQKAKRTAQSAAPSPNPYAVGEPRYVPSEQGLVLQEPNSSSVGSVGAGEVEIEDRILTPSAAPYAGTRFPPVEERRVGGEGLETPGYQPGIVDPNSENNQFIYEPVDPSAQAGAADSPTAEASNVEPTIIEPLIDQPIIGQGTPIQGTPIDEVASATIPSKTSAGTTSGAVVNLPSVEALPGSQDGVSTSGEAAATDAISASLSELDLYQQAFELLKQSKHNDAVTVFEQQIEEYPYGEYADDANYWIAESKYVNRDLDGSKAFFKVILDSYKQSPRLPDAMLKTAYIEQEQGNKIEARLLLQEILQYYPRSNAAISARNRLAELES
ncbi:MAG: tol-pal system protein YbgF [Pseudomonadota bacterium]